MNSSFLFFNTVRRNRPCSEVSSAVTQNSPVNKTRRQTNYHIYICQLIERNAPSPCAPCPSPALNIAPGTFTLKYSVDPGDSSLLSKLPPCSPGLIEDNVPVIKGK